MQKTEASLDEISNVFKILGDPTRLKLFSILLNGVHCNCELGSLTGLPNNLISHHMHVLTKAGLIKAERKTGDARWIYYSVNRDFLDQFQKALGVFLNPELIPDREPICPPCKKKNSTKNSGEDQHEQV